MSTHEQEGRAGGGVPNAFGNKVAWKWSRTMPRSLKASKFLCLLYVLRTMASASGELRFPDGKPIRIQDIAAATGCREQDARRYLEAGRRAGVVLAGERRRGTPTLYTVAGEAWPDWKAAEDYLKGTARRRQEDEEPEQGSGHSGTNAGEQSSGHSGTQAKPESGPQRPELEPGGEGPSKSTVDRWGSGQGGPLGSGHGGPVNPGVTQGVTHVMADVATQPQLVGGSAANSDHSSEDQAKADDEPFGRCEVCQVPLLRPGRKRCGAHAETPARGRNARAGRQRPIQAPLMTVVAGDAEGAQQATEAPQTPVSKIPNPFAPERTCGCGRTHRTGESQCPLCLELAREEAARLAAAHPRATTA
ncbi:FaeA/PapI family transcriptional regulator [Streptomyces chartreusis]|uniref:FaeA/PapI family transcriptional regulator n=1 Tax=Streptomyces chartreusis TaxID=1969 RepID=UPI002E188452|nr:FaeA/PapI family transcriptional regulator [Streptomyces chartreusis]